MLVTDCGYFPTAKAHGVFRDAGIDQAVVIVCAKGRGWCEVGAQRHTVAAGQVLIVPPSHPHSYGAEQDEPWTVWFMHVAGRDVDSLLAAGGFSAQAPVQPLRDMFAAIDLLESIVSRAARDTTAQSLLETAGAAWHVLALLASGRGGGASRVEVIDHARQHLETHLDRKVEVAELAASAGLSVSRFAELFREHVGMPVLKYQTSLRMARARELLDTTDLSVAQIAARVGYEDPFYFSRKFRSAHGMTAQRYRSIPKG
ncbi:AraC family transcriptional regulator [Microbacterium sp. NPDC057407]|uniref:AraC family transcriptional regulator n=1 Tax=Microbacterium sp. NPDC057407 TaxID=3346120 RepID=UPI00366A62B5